MDSLLIFCAVGIGFLILLGIFIAFQLDALRRGMRERALRTPVPPASGPGPGESPGPAPSLEDRKQVLEDQKKLFKVFVQQFPEVPDLPKKEQFDRFRTWREERGL